jgi:hypothetical protein
MPYDFMALSPLDFENLVADLLSKQDGVRYESFKAGKDSGIDLRYSISTEKTGSIIVQCKRYSPQNLSQLISSINKEKSNLAVLNPSRYILATTVRLSPRNKQTIIETMSPWIQSHNDIYGSDDLNHLLRIYPEVETAHFKLWISSTNVLEKIFRAHIFSQTTATIEDIQKNTIKFVVHEGLNKALELLESQHHVLIAGNPGIGKTTLARMLMCHYIKEEFEPIWLTRDIDDAWASISSIIGRDRKFILVYDDFLGRLRFDSEKFHKNEDSSLFNLIDYANAHSNIRIIFTTREYILEDAKRLHGVFHERANNIIKYTLSLENYTRKEKAQILFNHLYFSVLCICCTTLIIN